MIFPRVYEKPVLLDVAGAGEAGWNAICKAGSGAGSGAGFDCIGGDHATPSISKLRNDYILYENQAADLNAWRMNPDEVRRGL